MTTLTRPVRRECPRTMDRGRTIILELAPGDILRLRRKGTRTVYTTTVSALYHLAAKQFAAEVKREKAARRTNRKDAHR